MKLRNLLPVLLLVVMVLVACNQDAPQTGDPPGSAEATAVPDEATIDFEPASGSSDPAPETDDPAAVEPATSSPDAAEDRGEERPAPVANAVLSDEIIIEPGELPYTPTVLAVDSMPYRLDEVAGPSGLPAHWRIDFAPSDEDDQNAAAEPVLYVIPVEAYRALWAEAGDMGIDGTLTALIMTIEQGAQPFQDAGVPGLPVEHVGTAFNDLAAQGEYLALDNVTGLRFVGRFSDESTVVSNEGLTYVFLGFTNDGQHLVTFFHPIRTDSLPDSPGDATENNAERVAAEPFTYLSEQAALLNEQSADSFTPTLAELDSVVASLRWADTAPVVADDTEEAEATESQESIAAVSSDLAGSEWQWTALVQSGSTTAVADPARYAVRFSEEGTVALNAGCHDGKGTFETDETGAITIALSELKLAASCPPSYLDAILVGGLGNAATYSITESELAIALQFDNGTLTFIPSDR